MKIMNSYIVFTSSHQISCSELLTACRLPK